MQQRMSAVATADGSLGDTLASVIAKSGANFDELYAASARIAPLLGTYADNYCVGDGTTNDAAGFLAAANAASAAGAPLLLGPKVYFIDGVIVLPDRLRVVGMATDSGEMIGNGAFNKDDMRGLASQLRLSPTASLVPGHNNTFDGVLCLQKAVADLMPITNATIALAAANAFTGVCFDLRTKSTYDFHLANCMILGFANGVICDDGGTKVYERVRISRVMFDCLNPVYTAYVTDFGLIDRCHAWPFVTAHTSGGGDPVAARSGTAFYLGPRNDWTNVSQCVEWGYRNGFVIEASGGCTLTACMADNSYSAFTDSVGYLIRKKGVNNVGHTSLVGCKAAAQDTSVLADLGGTEANGSILTVTDFHAWGPSNVTFDVQSGGVRLLNTASRQSTVGLNMGVSAGNVLMANCTIAGATNPIVNSSPFAKIFSSNCIDGNGNMFPNYLKGTADGGVTHV